MPYRLGRYLDKYTHFLSFLTIISGFYCAVDLVRSKLYYQKYFSFSLTINEQSQLKRLRFINVVILENIPQFIIQLQYIQNSEQEVSVIVLFSVFLCLLSFFFAFLTQIGWLFHLYKNKNHRYRFESKIKGIIEIDSSNLGYYHSFSHKRLHASVLAVLDTCPGHELWKNRTDIKYHLEIYYIEDLTITYNQIKAFFDLKIQSATENMLAKEMANAIESMGDQSHDNYNIFAKTLLSSLSLKDIDAIRVKLGIVQNTENAEGVTENQIVLSRIVSNSKDTL